MDRRIGPRSCDLRDKMVAARWSDEQRAATSALWNDPAYRERQRVSRRESALRRLPMRFWNSVDKTGECWLWTGYLQKQGYGQTIYPGGKSILAHRLAWLLTHGDLPSAEQLLRHKCDNPRCVRPDHLEVGDAASNATDRVQRGRSTQAKLAPEQVQAIRLQREQSPAAIALEYGISESTAWKILHGHAWKSLPWPEGAEQ